jgi:hypothetical protein
LNAAVVPADGGYEGNVSPAKAEPGWMAGSPWGPAPSLLEWATIGESGGLVQKEGAPEGIQMHLGKSPLTATSYTVEIRFRITRDDFKKRDKMPLYILISRKGAGYHWLNARLNNNDQVVVGSNVNLGQEYYAESALPSCQRSDWATVRLVVEDHGAYQQATVYGNGQKIQEITTGEKSSRDSYFVISSPSKLDGWEIAYVRWLNQALPLAEELERQSSPEERARHEQKRKETEYKRKLAELFTDPEGKND